MDLLEFWDVVRQNRLLIAVVTFIAMALALTAGALMSPVYRAQVVLAPILDTSQGNTIPQLGGQFAGIASLSSMQIGASDFQKAVAVPMLNSYQFGARFIQDHSLLPVFFSGLWNAEMKQWVIPWYKPFAQVPSENDAFRYFHRKVRFVEYDAATGLLKIAVEWKNPQQAALWANDLSQRLNAEIQQTTVRDATRNIEYLRQELEKTSEAEIRQMIFRHIEVQLNTIMLANSRPDIAFRVIDPAYVPDEDDYVRPQRLLMFAVSLFLGLSFGFIAAFFRHQIYHTRQGDPSD